MQTGEPSTKLTSSAPAQDGGTGGGRYEQAKELILIDEIGLLLHLRLHNFVDECEFLGLFHSFHHQLVRFHHLVLLVDGSPGLQVRLAIDCGLRQPCGNVSFQPLAKINDV